MRGCALFLAAFAIAACRSTPVGGVGATGSAMSSIGGACARSANDAGAMLTKVDAQRCFAVCPHDAARGKDGRCACAHGLATIDGACVADDGARAYCGAGSTWNGERCVTRACALGEARDTASGACVVARTLREMAVRDHLMLDPDQRLGCHDQFTLVVSAGHPACLPESLACPRGAVRKDGACAPELACDAGEIRDARACAPLVSNGSARDPTLVDVSRWSAAAFGPDGGDGAIDLCAPLAESPRAFGVGPAAKLGVRIEIELNFPDNDVTQVTTKVNTTEAAADRPLPSDGAALATRSVVSLVALLRALGGTSSAASLSTRVICAIDGGLPPMSVPRAGPLSEAEHASSAP